jgi:hypothetical protein
MHRGYFAVWRKSEDHPFFTEPREYSKWEAWLDLLMQAQHETEPKRVTIGMNVFECHYGESLKSIKTWSHRWMWSRSKVFRFLKLLKKMEQIEFKSETVTTRILIINYKTYDPRRNGSETEVKRERNASETQANTDKKVNNDKNEKNKEKEIIKKKKPAPKKKPEKPAPESFPITDQMIKYASDKGYIADLEDLTEGFLVHHRAKGTLFSDWYAAWQKWLRNQLAWYPEKNVPPGCDPVQSKQLQPTTYSQALDLERRQQVEAIRRYEDECNQKNDQRGACQDQPRIERKAVN